MQIGMNCEFKSGTIFFSTKARIRYESPAEGHVHQEFIALQEWNLSKTLLFSILW